MGSVKKKREYEWFDIVDENEPILQGDFFNSCPVVTPPSEIKSDVKSIETDVLEYDVIILSQSCDLIYEKVDLVLVCPTWTLKEIEKKYNFFKSSNGKEKLRQGNVPGYHLLNKSILKGFERDFVIVDFHNVYGVPFDYLNKLAKTTGKRLRLLPPYREHLSQSFARFFMRVGLPMDIPSFIKKNPKK